MNPAVKKSKAPRGWLWTALVLLVLGLVGCGVSAAGAWRIAGVVGQLAEELEQTTPYGAEFEYTAETSQAVVMMTTVGLCNGTDAEGNPITFRPATDQDPMTDETGEFGYVYFLVFSTVAGTEYTITCGEANPADQFAVVSDPGLDVFPTGFAMAAAGAGSFLLFMFLAFICLIVGLVRRANWKKRNGPYSWPGGTGPYQSGQNPYGLDPYSQTPYGPAPYGQPQPPGSQGQAPAPPTAPHPWVPPAQPPTGPPTAPPTGGEGGASDWGGDRGLPPSGPG